MKKPTPAFYHRLVFLINWGALTFSAGVAVLFFLLRKWMDSAGQDGSGNKILVFLLMLLVVAAGFSGARWLEPLHTAGEKSFKKLLAMVAPAVVASLCLLWVLSPKNVYGRNTETTMGNRFVIGPYPTREKIDSLKGAGFDGIISLLSPADIPFEPVLIKEESGWAKDAGIALVSAPMLPWISDNADAHVVFDSLINKTKGRYYVHCYLGRDRVGVVKKWIEEMLHMAITTHNVTERTLEEVKVFERGTIWKLPGTGYFTPFPTNEELTGFIAGGKFKTVINLLDTATEASRLRIQQQNLALQHTGIRLVNIPLNENAGTAQYRQVLDSMQKATKPLVIIAWRTEDATGKALLETWNKTQPEKATKL